jgi:hypothetical protein
MKERDFTPVKEVEEKTDLKRYKIEDFKLSKKLGRGAFGTVVLAEKSHY